MVNVGLANERMVDSISRVNQDLPTAAFLESVRRVIKRWYFSGPIAPAGAVFRYEDVAKRLNKSLIFSYDCWILDGAKGL